MITVILYLKKIGWLHKGGQKEKAPRCSAGQPNIEKSESTNNQNLQEKDGSHATTKRE